MDFQTYEVALNSRDLAYILCERAEKGLDVILGPSDMELAALGLFLIVLLSGHSLQVFETPIEQD